MGAFIRSDDAGETWRKINNENRIWGRGSDFACVQVDPKNENKIYIANTTTYRSTDAGQTFIGIKGAPGGDDYHTIWINPQNPDIIFLGVDQGATLSVNGGAHLEFLVQPADRAVLSRDHGQSLSVLGLWWPAGERICGRREQER